MKNKKTTIMGYLGIFAACAILLNSFLSGEAIDIGQIMLALGIGGAGVGNLSSADGGL